MRASLVTMVLVAVTLAGCADGGQVSEDTDDEFDDIETKATSTTGVIRGVVFDPAIVPIAGATITIKAADKQTTSSEEGAFFFEDLEPGAHFLEVTKLGYERVQASANVEAGIDKPPIVKIQLEANPSLAPRIVPIQYEGFLQCSFTLVVVGFNACGLGEILGMPLDDPLVVHDVEANASFSQTEMLWESTQPLGDALDLMYSWGNCGGFFCDVSVSGPSPQVLSVDAEQFQTMLDDPADPSRPGLMIRVFGTESDMAQGTGLGMTFDQEFVHYTHLFYGFTPDDGWQFSVDGDHPIPT